MIGGQSFVMFQTLLGGNEAQASTTHFADAIYVYKVLYVGVWPSQQHYDIWLYALCRLS